MFTLVFSFFPEYSRYCLGYSSLSAAQLRLMTDDDKVLNRYDIYSFSGLVFFFDRLHFTILQKSKKLQFSKLWCLHKCFHSVKTVCEINKYTKQINPRLYNICATFFFFFVFYVICLLSQKKICLTARSFLVPNVLHASSLCACVGFLFLPQSKGMCMLGCDTLTSPA